MSATGVETIPTSWDDERDNGFFRITRSLFSPCVTYGGSVLLASYDEESAATSSTTGIPATATVAEPTAVIAR